VRKLPFSLFIFHGLVAFRNTLLLFNNPTTTMSQVYATEPSTSGRVIFQTTRGDLEIQLWCRECPATSRFFLQLCLDGFFDNMIFHRIVPDFLIQTGAVRKGDKAGASSASAEKAMEQYRAAVQADEALQRRKYEVHSRLRFNHRGQVAMALGVGDDDDVELQPQFFVTLEEAPYLDGKNTLFGTINGPTIFNAIRIGKTFVDESTNQPIDLDDAPCIKAVKIVENPLFTDLVPQASVPWRQQPQEKIKSKKKKRKGKKDVNVLSFGDELEEGLEGDSGMQSSHDMVASATLKSQVDETVLASSLKQDRSPNEAVRDEGTSDNEEVVKPSTIPGPAIQEPKEKPMQQQNGSHTGQNKTARLPPPPPPIDEPSEPAKSIERSSFVEERRAKYRKKSASNKSTREEETMNKLFAFQRKVRGSIKSTGESDRDDSLASRMMKKAEGKRSDGVEEDSTPTYHGQVLEDGGDESLTGGDWMKTKFKCRKHMDHAAGREEQRGGDGRDMNDYVVLDGKRDDVHRHHKRHKHKSSGRDRHKGRS
jgi:peptidyl-prolyl cis-trans isomerase SDCCAG10